jgi:cytidylate kinase
MEEGTSGGLATVEADLRRRDDYDSTRAMAPLSVAPDAVHLDSTELTLDQVIDTLVDLARERASAGARG